MSLADVVGLAVEDLRERSRRSVYRRDPEAWLWDVLGKRWYSKQSEIAEQFLVSPRLAVKSGNGVGKSQIVADLITWIVATSDPSDTLCIVSAPTLSQIEKVIFAYLKVNRGVASGRGFELPGRITETLAWKLDGAEGSEFLVFGKRPSDKDIVSSFQGTRKKRTLVFLDEGGGLPADMFTAAEAVATGADSRIMTIGNPDRRGTEFHRIFTDPRLMQDWVRQTISVFDLPTFTGERVYEDDEAQAALLAGLTSVEWVEHKRRAWGEDSARFKAKVLGEFPDESDNAFFSQEVIDRAFEVEVQPDVSGRPVLGVDVARFGSDETRVYVNDGGRVRLFDDGTADGGVWSKLDTFSTAQRIHRIAELVGARLVNVDANGVGGGVVDALLMSDEFRDATYEVCGVIGSAGSPDSSRWANARAWQYDRLRELMGAGVLDLDYEDTVLREQLVSQTYKFNARGAVQITSKDEMRKGGLSSPDALDAVILSVLDVDDLVGAEQPRVMEYDMGEIDSGFYDSSPQGFW